MFRPSAGWVVIPKQGSGNISVEGHLDHAGHCNHIYSYQLCIIGWHLHKLTRQHQHQKPGKDGRGIPWPCCILLNYFLLNDSRKVGEVIAFNGVYPLVTRSGSSQQYHRWSWLNEMGHTTKPKWMYLGRAWATVDLVGVGGWWNSGEESHQNVLYTRRKS